MFACRISNFIKSFVDNYVLKENGPADLIRKLNDKPEWIKAFHKIHGTIFIQIFKKSAPTSLNSRKYRKVLKELLDWSQIPTYESGNKDIPKKNGSVEEKLENIRFVINKQDATGMTALQCALKKR